MAELRTIVLKWDVHTGKLKCNTSYLKREERVDVDLYVTNNGEAYALPSGWALNFTVKGDDATDGDALVAITSWSASSTTGLYQATTQAISSAELDTYLAVNGSTGDDVASKYVDVDIYYTVSAAMRAKSDTLRLTLKPDVGRVDDGTPTGTAVSITASGYTMNTNRLLGRTTAGTGAVEEISLGTGLSMSSGVLSAHADETVATNTQAEQGTNDTAMMTALRTHHAIQTYESSFLIPTFRHSQSVTKGEKLGMMVTYDNFATVTDLYPGDLFTDPDNQGVRDPSLIRFRGTWYIAYTKNAFASPANKFGICKSTDLQNWTHHGDVTVADCYQYPWAPKWFFDRRTGQIHIIFTWDRVAPNGPNGAHTAFIGTPTDDTLLNWSWTLIGGLPAYFYDCRLDTDGKYYYAVGVARGSANSLDIYRSTSLTSGYTLFTTPNIGVTAEQCWIQWLGGTRWRLTYNDNPNQTLYERISTDGMTTWGAARVLNVMGADAAQRSFVQIVPWIDRKSEFDNADIEGGGGGSGTVTSVAVSGSDGISVSGSPVTSSGTIALSLGNITPDTVLADNGAGATSQQQLTVEASGAGGIGLRVIDAANNQILLGCEYTGGNVVSRNSGGCAIIQHLNNVLQIVGQAVTSGSNWSPPPSDVRIAINLTTGVINVPALTASQALATDASKNIVSVTNTGTGNNVMSESPTITTPLVAGVLTASNGPSFSIQPANTAAQPVSGSPWIRVGGGGNDSPVFNAGANSAYVFLCYDRGAGVILSEGTTNATTYLTAAATGTLAVTSDGSTLGTVRTGTVELGNASDTTLSRVSAGVVAIEGKTIATLSDSQTFTATQTFRQYLDVVDISDATVVGRYGDDYLSFSSGGNTIRILRPSFASSFDLTLPNSAGSSGQVLQTNGSGVLSWVTPSTGGATNIWIGASEFIPRTTSGCGVNSSETSTNRVNYDTLDFDATTQEFAQVIRAMPSNWNNGTVTARFYWTADSGSGGVVWSLAGRALADDDALDTARGTSQITADTLIAAGDMHRTVATAAVTIAGTPAAGVPVVFEIARVPADASDTLGVDARLIGVEITFTSA